MISFFMRIVLLFRCARRAALSQVFSSWNVLENCFPSDVPSTLWEVQMAGMNFPTRSSAVPFYVERKRVFVCTSTTGGVLVSLRVSF